MRYRFKFLILVLAPLGLALGSTPSMASVSTFVASGSSGGEALNASATFTTSAGAIMITLTNTDTAAQVQSVGSAVSDITFTLSNNAGTFSGATASGQLGNVSGPITSPPPRGGIVTDVAGSPGRFIGVGGGNFTTNASSPTITLEAIGGGTPSQMILPFVPNGGSYPNANASVYDGHFSPFTIGPATFTLFLAGVTAGTTVTSATFSFGTGPDTFLPGTPTVVVPEPATSFLVLTALAPLGVVGLIRHRRRRTTAPA